MANKPVKAQVQKKYHDVEIGAVIKHGTVINYTKKRAEKLATKGFIKILSIEKDKPTTDWDAEYTLKELREKFPNITAKTKKEFISKIE